MSEQPPDVGAESDPWKRFEFTDDEVARAKETIRRREEEQGRRLFGDGPHFLIPDADTDALPGSTPFPDIPAFRPTNEEPPATGSSPGSADWDYYLVDRYGSGDVDRDGEVVRIRRGHPRTEGFVAGSLGRWLETPIVADLAVSTGTGDARPISEWQARSLLTSWTAARRLVRLPEGLEPVGSPLPDTEWEYFLVGQPDSRDDLDLTGDIVRHRPGSPYEEGFAVGADGSWAADDVLAHTWATGQGGRYVIPISPDTAAWLTALGVQRGRWPQAPADVAPTPPPWATTVRHGDVWAYVLLRRPDLRDAPLVTGPGRLARHRLGSTLVQGQALVPPGDWRRSRDLYDEFVLGRGRWAAVPVTQDVARQVAARMLREGEITRIPGDLDLEG